MQDKREALVDSFLCYLERDIREFRSVMSDTIDKRRHFHTNRPVLSNKLINKNQGVSNSPNFTAQQAIETFESRPLKDIQLLNHIVP